MPVFQERLKLLRKERGLFQKEIAEILGIAERNYQRYEIIKTDLPISKIMILADYYNVSIDYLVGRSDNPNSHTI